MVALEPPVGGNHTSPLSRQFGEPHPPDIGRQEGQRHTAPSRGRVPSTTPGEGGSLTPEFLAYLWVAAEEGGRREKRWHFAGLMWTSTTEQSPSTTDHDRRRWRTGARDDEDQANSKGCRFPSHSRTAPGTSGTNECDALRRRRLLSHRASGQPDFLRWEAGARRLTGSPGVRTPRLDDSGSWKEKAGGPATVCRLPRSSAHHGSPSCLPAGSIHGLSWVELAMAQKQPQ